VVLEESLPPSVAKSQWSSGVPDLPVHMKLALKKQQEQKDNTQMTVADKTYETLVTKEVSVSNTKNCPVFFKLNLNCCW